MNWFRTVDQASEKLVVVSGAICIALPVITLIVVGIRAVVPAGVPIWSLDVCELLMWFLVYLPIGYVWRKGRHVRVNVIVDKLPRRLRQVIDMAILFITLGISSIMVWAGTRASWASLIELRRTYTEIPEYPFSVIIPVGLGFLVYEVAAYLVKKIRTMS